MVGGHGHGHARCTQCGNGRHVGVAQGVVGAGQEHGHGARLAHGGDALGAQVFDVVTRQRTITRRQCRAAHVRQLFGMQLDRQAQRLRGLEHLLGLRQREANRFAKHIHRVHQAFGRQCGHHLFTHQADVSVAAPREFGRQRMCTQKRGAHRDAKHLAQSTGHAQLFSLVFQAQAIARFDLDGANPFGQQSL